jgi:hypothetical protein
VYSHCLFCTGELGTNEAIEKFPIGRRLAFDAHKGRLWVICPRCQRWNLTPLEERWEAVESAERQFRGQKLRAQTDNIGLARLRDGTELVRIGPALRPEFAAWRYGRVFLHRLRRQLLIAGGGTAAASGAIVAGAPLLASIVAAPFVLVPAYLAIMVGLGGLGRWRTTSVVGEDGKILKVVAADMQHVRLLGHEGDDPFRFTLKHSYGKQELTGEHARRALGALLARVNGRGARSETISAAASLIAERGSAERAAADIARASEPFAREFDARWRSFQRLEWQTQGVWKRDARDWLDNSGEPRRMGPLWRLPREQRLALEMALHESTEQRALEGELALLEAAWREAEEIAAIADSL